MINSLSDYYFFVTIVEEGSLTKAAKKLAIPKSKLSRRLALLEQTLGSQLLIRTTRRQQLTENGLLLFQTCKPHVDALHDIEALIGEAAFKVKGKLKLLLPLEFFNTVIGALITDFALAYPDIEIHCHHYHQAYPDFDHQYDLVFVLHENDLPSSNWIGRTLLSFSQSIYTAEQSDKQQITTLAELTKLNVIASNEEEKWLFRTKENVEAIKPNIIMVLSSPEMRVEACQREIGLIKLPDYIGNNLKKIAPVKTEKPLIAQQLTLLYQSRKLPAKTRMFLDYFQSKIGCLS